MEEIARVADLAERLRKYFNTVGTAYAFFAFGMVICGYWLVFVSLKDLLYPGAPWSRVTPVAALAMWAVVALCVVALVKTAPKSRWRTEEGWREGLRWTVSFLAPFLAVYLAPLPDPRLYTVVWYPALGVSLLLVHLLLEREWISRRSVVARPFLMSSLATLATTPLVVYALRAGDVACSWAMALGLMLLSYYVAGVYAMYKASRLFS